MRFYLFTLFAAFCLPALGLKHFSSHSLSQDARVLQVAQLPMACAAISDYHNSCASKGYKTVSHDKMKKLWTEFEKLDAAKQAEFKTKFGYDVGYKECCGLATCGSLDGFQSELQDFCENEELFFHQRQSVPTELQNTEVKSVDDLENAKNTCCWHECEKRSCGSGKQLIKTKKGDLVKDQETECCESGKNLLFENGDCVKFMFEKAELKDESGEVLDSEDELAVDFKFGARELLVGEVTDRSKEYMEGSNWDGYVVWRVKVANVGGLFHVHAKDLTSTVQVECEMEKQEGKLMNMPAVGDVLRVKKDTDSFGAGFVGQTVFPYKKDTMLEVININPGNGFFVTRPPAPRGAVNDFEEAKDADALEPLSNCVVAKRQWLTDVSGNDERDFHTDHLKCITFVEHQGEEPKTAWDFAVKRGQQVAEENICLGDDSFKFTDLDAASTKKKEIFDCLVKELKLDFSQEFQGTSEQEKLIQVIALLEWQRMAINTDAAETSALDFTRVNNNLAGLGQHVIQRCSTQPMGPDTVCGNFAEIANNAASQQLKYGDRTKTNLALQKLVDKMLSPSFSFTDVDNFKAIVNDLPELKSFKEQTFAKQKNPKRMANSFQALANKGGVCQQNAALTSRLIQEMFKVEIEEGTMDIQKPKGPNHVWVRIAFNRDEYVYGKEDLQKRVCTHLDPYWAIRSGRKQNPELHTKWIFKTNDQIIKALQRASGASAATPRSHNMFKKWANCEGENDLIQDQNNSIQASKQ